MKILSSASARAAVAFVAVAAAVAAVPAQAANVGVSVSIGDPGFFGRVDIGSRPPPPLVYAQPMVIAPAPYAVQQRPIYLRVPPGQANQWGRYCGRYAACGQPVYFVQDRWYQEQYVQPYYRDHGRDHGRGHGPRGRGPDRHDHDRDDGPGRGRGRGHDR